MLKICILALILALTPLASAGAQKSQNYSEAKGKPMHVLLNTNQGDIIIELDQLAAPKTAANFVQYVNDGHYNGTIFHRVISGFMVQGGGLNADMKEQSTRPPIENEAKNGLKNDHYTVAMARTSEPHSATAQFFINTKDNAFLNFTGENPNGWGYAVFGRVVKGREVVDKIEKVETTSKSFHDDVPVTPVIIEKAEILENFDSDQTEKSN
jgi:peptidyl-prolyl cis-trans isomerase B (cyclophilin B)